MAIVTINIPDTEKSNLYLFVNERGGEIVDIKKPWAQMEDFDNDEDSDEITHGEFFGENIRRAINIFKKRLTSAGLTGN